MESIAMGFSNTVDCELEWDPAYLERLIIEYGIKAEDLEEKTEIQSEKDLLCSILFHISEGSGCGMAIENPQIIDNFIKGTKGKITLGGTNVRASYIIDAMGERSLIHLVSINKETLDRLPSSVRTIGGEQFTCCYPHVVFQFPAGAQICAGDICINISRSNRCLYSGDIACAQMPISTQFLSEAKESEILIVGSFDMIPDKKIVDSRINMITGIIGNWDSHRPLVFYEHGGFANNQISKTVVVKMAKICDVMSMNEDELTALYKKKIDLMNPDSVLEALRFVKEKIGESTLIVHSQNWVVAYGTLAEELTTAIQSGIDAASTRYYYGDVTKQLMDEIRLKKKQPEAVNFSMAMESSCNQIKCIPAYILNPEKATTVGLGDSFVGGFAYAYCQNKRS